MTPRQTRVDWDAARAYYIALGPVDRTYRRVAAEFTVSETTVKKWAKRHEWPKLAAEADQTAAEQAERTAIRTRTERVTAALRFVDKALDRAQTRLDREDLEVKASDIPHLMRLAELLLGEPTDRIAVAQLEPLLDAYDSALDRLRELAQDRGEADTIIAGLDETLLGIAAAARERERA